MDCKLLEEHGSRITQFGLPQPSNHLDEIIRVQSQYCDNAALIMARDEMIWRLNFEQSENYESYNTSPCAITRLAALNYDGGRTAHSLFSIPVEDNGEG
ncbi:20336_t:CDS:2, partial [Gigaspora rosea]